MRTFLQVVTGLLLGISLTACGGSASHDTAQVSTDTSAEIARGAIDGDRFVQSLTVDEIHKKLDGINPVIAPTIHYPVEIHHIVYETIAPDGSATTASGTIAFPKGTSRSFPLASYQHGTAVFKHYAATSSEIKLLPLIFATSGYIAVAPDYLGLEDSPGLHPFVHADSLASAVVDMLRASRDYCEDNKIGWNKQLFLLGYSEGGYATMAAARAIEKRYSNEFSITASAPMAGPYDLSGTMVPLFLRSSENANPYYLAYTLLAYQSVYGFSDSPSDIFTSPYADSLPSLFDGAHTGNEINTGLPRVPKDMLNPSFVDDIKTNPDNPFLADLAANDLVDWVPKAPLHLYHCDRDNVVPFQNSQVAYDSFSSQGESDVKLVTLQGNDHAQCAAPSLIAGKTWFDSWVEIH